MTETRSGFHRTTPECVVLPVKQGATPSPKPPVRIFIGTEPAQFRPERVLMWSIEQVRDPGRVYEIYLMKDLSGYRKWFWTTSFTNYRFAIPHYAGGRGRAIYNDEDQIYLGDPAELFDMDMGDHGYLTISDRDTAVMLIDCERMARVWTLRDAQRSRKHALLDLGVATGECGPLPPEWHARDDPEFVEGRTRLLHYTTLHTQPWRPYPERFIYRDHPLDHLWFSLEASANRAGFQVFTRERPSVFWRGRLPAIEADGRVAAGQPAVDESIRDLIRRAKAKTVLLVTPGASGEPPLNPEAWEVQRAVRLSPTQVLDADPEDDRYDGVACTAGLEEVPIDDVAWVIDALFQRAAGFVFAAVRSQRPARHWITPPAGTVHTPEWWVDQFDAVAARYPNVHWELLITGGPQTGSNRGEFRHRSWATPCRGSGCSWTASPATPRSRSVSQKSWAGPTSACSWISRIWPTCPTRSSVRAGSPSHPRARVACAHPGPISSSPAVVAPRRSRAGSADSPAGGPGSSSWAAWASRLPRPSTSAWCPPTRGCCRTPSRSRPWRP
jgi:hypothetical protein